MQNGHNTWNFIDAINPTDDLEALADQYTDIMNIRQECAGTYTSIILYNHNRQPVIAFDDNRPYPKPNQTWTIIRKWLDNHKYKENFKSIPLWNDFFHYATSMPQTEKMTDTLNKINNYVTTHPNWEIQLNEWLMTP